MRWQSKLKEANVSIHVIATGAGASLQQSLWEVPGSSAYLSGASFPYAPEEQAELLGFMPEHFCSAEAAVDLASAAYMKAYNFGGKSPVGLGLTATVASEKEHRGDHRLFFCIMTDDTVKVFSHKLIKDRGEYARILDGGACDSLAFNTLLKELNIYHYDPQLDFKDATDLATERFFARPFFTATGERLAQVPSNLDYALMSGAFNPPHPGHFGPAEVVRGDYHKDTVFEITARPPHKEALTVQQCLQRSKMLRGHHRLFTVANPYYIDKARAYPGVPLVLGADAMVRMLDPKWGLDTKATLQEFYDLGTDLYVVGRDVEGEFTTMEDIANGMILKDERQLFLNVAKSVQGRWDLSSTEIRNKLL